MPNNTYKSAAVPFVNQKGERSMKRVKVERYVAGKKPGYAKDEDDEYYTTDDEDVGIQDEELDEDEKSDDEDDEEDYLAAAQKLSRTKSTVCPTDQPVKEEDTHDESDEDFDDPRFRRLKQLESKASTSRLIDVQTKLIVKPKLEDKAYVIDDDEEEEEIKLRHVTARARTLEEPVGPQVVLGDFSDQYSGSKQKELDQNDRPIKVETEDILKDLKLTGILPGRQTKLKDSSKLEENIKDMIDQAKQEANFTAQLYKKIEEDTKRELEIEARKKNDFGTNDMTTINTDDEDEELAYEEWKLREIKRVLRDRSERVLETKAR